MLDLMTLFVSNVTSDKSFVSERERCNVERDFFVSWVWFVVCYLFLYLDDAEVGM